MILCPLLPPFFSKFSIILWNIVLALSFCHFSFPVSFLSFSPFFVGTRVVFMIFFPPQAIFIFQYINPWIIQSPLRVELVLSTRNIQENSRVTSEKTCRNPHLGASPFKLVQFFSFTELGGAQDPSWVQVTVYTRRFWECDLNIHTPQCAGLRRKPLQLSDHHPAVGKIFFCCSVQYSGSVTFWFRFESGDP